MEMQKKRVRSVLVLIAAAMAVLTICVLSSCGQSAQPQQYELRDRYYLEMIDERLTEGNVYVLEPDGSMSSSSSLSPEEKYPLYPFVSFDIEKGEWRTGRAGVISFSLGGNFTMRGNRLTCRDKRYGLTVIMELIGEDQLQIVSIKDKSGQLDWLKAGDVLVHTAI